MLGMSYLQICSADLRLSCFSTEAWFGSVPFHISGSRFPHHSFHAMGLSSPVLSMNKACHKKLKTLKISQTQVPSDF